MNCITVILVAIIDKKWLKGKYPMIPLVLAAGLVLLICVIVPTWTYKADIKLSVVERLRISEEG